jgi:hypothetical protein
LQSLELLEIGKSLENKPESLPVSLIEIQIT